MEPSQIKSIPWLAELSEQVRKALAQSESQKHTQVPALESELESLRNKRLGWSDSLANPKLHPELRRTIEQEWTSATERMEQIEQVLAERVHHEQQANQVLDPSEVLRRLDRLEEVLGNYNPTACNLELSLHIDRIVCSPDKTVTMRTCKLGALAGAIELLTDESGSSSPASADASVHPPSSRQTGPRRRGRLRLADIDYENESDPRALADFAADPNRFAGLSEEWFWEDHFQIPKRKGWAETHALEVAKTRATGTTEERLAKHFRRSIPTIRQALRYAAALDESVSQLPRKMPRRRWHEDSAMEVAAKKAEGMSTAELAAHFKRCETTILKALDHAAKRRGQSGDSETIQ